VRASWSAWSCEGFHTPIWTTREERMSNEWVHWRRYTVCFFFLFCLCLLCVYRRRNLHADDLLSMTGHDRALRSVGATRATSLFSSSAREIPNFLSRGSRPHAGARYNNGNGDDKSIRQLLATLLFLYASPSSQHDLPCSCSACPSYSCSGV
jgi:hypothetical protein